MSHRDDISPEIYADAIGDEDFFVGPHPRKHWTPSAVYCHTSGMNCGSCFNHRFYGLVAYASCYMPLAVNKLLAQRVKIPASLLERVHLWKISGKLET